MFPYRASFPAAILEISEHWTNGHRNGYTWTLFDASGVEICTGHTRTLDAAHQTAAETLTPDS